MLNALLNAESVYRTGIVLSAYLDISSKILVVLLGVETVLKLANSNVMMVTMMMETVVVKNVKFKRILHANKIRREEAFA